MNDKLDLKDYFTTLNWYAQESCSMFDTYSSFISWKEKKGVLLKSHSPECPAQVLDLYRQVWKGELNG